VIRETLTEYDEREISLSSELAAALQAAGGTRLSVLQGSSAGRFRIRASSYVGTVLAGDVELRIRPKVPIANVLHLLGHAGLPASWLTGEQAGYDVAPDAAAAFAELYGRTLTNTLARGPLHGYREHHDELVALRGRIDVDSQLRRPARVTPLACRYVDFTPDIDANRYVKSATRMLLRTPDVPASARRLLKHGMIQLEHVDDEVPRIDLPQRIVHTRLTRHYQPLLELAELVRRSVTVSDQAGTVVASTFLLDMNAVFERFLEHALREELRGRLEVSVQERIHLDVDEQVLMRPDLVFRDRRGDVVLVGDVKYKLTDEGFGRTSDYFQLLAYCTRYDVQDGVLLYATVDGETPPTRITVEHAGVRLHTLAVQLSGGPFEIVHEIARIAATLAAFGSEQTALSRVEPA
jgi:5-methylcytosine-specific restriction enzyme subunit McrC